MGSNNSAALLDVRGLDVFYGPIQAIHDVSMSMAEGEMVALLGANGAGKTTILRTISGALSPKRGEITFEGTRIEGKPAHKVVEKGISHLPEGRELFPQLTVTENLKLGYWILRKKGSGLQAALDRVMAMFPILSERASQQAGTLSGGEQQMLGIARSLMCDPKLLVVDELSLGLAPIIVAQLFDILNEVNRAGTSVLIVEQFVHMALKNTHRAYVLAKGEVVMQGASSELLEREDLVASYLGGEREESSEGAPVVVEKGRKRR